MGADETMERGIGLSEMANLVRSVQKSHSELTASIQELVDHQAKQIFKLQRMQFWIIVSLLFDVSLTAFGGFLVHSVSQNSQRIEVVQIKTSTDALCPLYDVFLDSWNPKSRQALDDPRGYDQSFKVIEVGSRALGCKHVTRGRD